MYMQMVKKYYLINVFLVLKSMFVLHEKIGLLCLYSPNVCLVNLADRVGLTCYNKSKPSQYTNSEKKTTVKLFLYIYPYDTSVIDQSETKTLLITLLHESCKQTLKTSLGIH